MIIAVDFDGTLCEYKNPGIGAPKLDVIQKVRDLAKEHYLILWTNRRGKALRDAINWCKYYNIIFKRVNKNAPGKKSSRKIYADIYLDDKAINVENFNCIN